RLRPDQFDARYNLGNALYRQKQYPEAVAAYREALKLKPADAEAHASLGNALYDQGLHKSAAAAFQEALRLRPEAPGLRYNAARAGARAGYGQGKDAPKPDPQERARLRRQALGLLQADLRAWRGRLDKEPDKAGPAARDGMRHWQQDKDLAGVRATEA